MSGRRISDTFSARSVGETGLRRKAEMLRRESSWTVPTVAFSERTTTPALREKAVEELLRGRAALGEHELAHAEVLERVPDVDPGALVVLYHQDGALPQLVGELGEDDGGTLHPSRGRAVRDGRPGSNNGIGRNRTAGR
ncbi:MAG: hypothetical protein HYY66_01535 [Candidatus Tectomicrobia bacterium]|nr:hypothetical protein [Candidatus Tectomicrobia bacterium]